MMKRHIHLLLLITIVFCIPVAFAQENDQPLVEEISYGMTVTENITDFAFFDWWKFDVSTGDKIIISMEADNGLQPLLGLMDSGGNLVARSDLQAAATVNGTAFLEYNATTEGQHTIIATREGRDEGTTTGRYLLTLTNRDETVSSRPNPFMEAEFRCNEWLLTNALTFVFNEDVELPDTILPGQVTEYYRFTVFGLDGFEPVVRLQSDILLDRPLDCTDSAQATDGSQVDLPFLDSPITIVEDDDADAISMVTLTNSGEGDPLGEVAVTLGAKDGTSGRFIMLVEGFAINDRNDSDEIIVRRGPFAGENPLDIYAIGYSNSRLDPILYLYDPDLDIALECDDIGAEDCATLTDLTQASFIIGEDGATYTGDRFDSALRIDSSDNKQQSVSIRSRASTSGNYLLVFVGELPPR